MRYNKYSNVNYKINTMRMATDLHSKVLGLIDKYNKYKKEIVLNSSKLRDVLIEKTDTYYGIEHESIILMLMYQNELNSFVPTLQEQMEALDVLLVQIEAYQKSPNDIKAFEKFISDKKDILKNTLKLAPKFNLDDIADLNGIEHGFQSIFQDLNESGYELNNKISQTKENIDDLYHQAYFYKNNKIYDGYNYIREFKGNEEYIKYLEGEIVNLNNYLENKELDECNISDIKAEIEDYKEYSKSLLKENNELKVYFEQAGISLQDKNVNILNLFELTKNDVSEQLTISLAGFKVLDTHAINDAAIKVGLIKPFIPMVPQVN
ncbi:hypothetical protein ABN063_04815 [Providencia vermicola]|uniref:hypothetical protein n=1 Tax=Providencia vermicola TaxID=333965 RepID=UPI0032DB672C